MVKYPKNSAHPIKISEPDYARLNDEQEINDTLIDFYLKFLINTSIPDPEQFYVFGSFFYT
jgi:Ulp1 family protease